MLTVYMLGLMLEDDNLALQEVEKNALRNAIGQMQKVEAYDDLIGSIQVAWPMRAPLSPKPPETHHEPAHSPRIPRLTTMARRVPDSERRVPK